MTNISVEWVEEIPDRLSRSPYDPIADQVRQTGKIAKIETTKGTMSTLANRLRNRYKDLEVKSRTTEDGFFVFIETKEGE